MKRNEITISVVIFIAMVITFVCGYIYRGQNTPPPIVLTDTIEVTDTFKMPRERGREVVRYKTKKLPYAVHDTIPNTDSAEVVLPIERKVYEDSTYKAVITGYDVSLDSIYIKHRIIKETQYIKAKEKRWGAGIHSGIGISGKGKVEPFIGIGISYNILNF